jgi:murein L,D-transpeptidase YcbB/YkuD
MIYLVLFTCFYGWKGKPHKIEEGDFTDMEQVSSGMKRELSILKKDTTFTHYFDTLGDFYAQRHFDPLWMDKIQDSIFMVHLHQLSDSVVFDGFKREHYHFDTIFSLAKTSKNRKDKKINKTLALLELFISNAFVTLWHDKVMGRTDPREVLGAKYTLPFPNHPGFNLLEALNTTKGLVLLQTYQPSHTDYPKLKMMLVDAYGKTAGSETMIDTAGIRKLKPGDTSAIVPMLAVRLVELGLAPDSFISHYKDSFIYTRPLAQRIIDIQKTSNLTDDGIIGKSTLKLLNASENDKIGDIRANMERIRWFGIEPEKPYVRVNLPEFMLYMYYPDSVKSMPVCIGKGKERYYDQKTKKYKVSQNYLDRPMNHETPQVFSNIDFVILNPTWTVPSSIVGREMYNLILKNPGYLAKNNFQVFKDRKPVDPYSINWRKLSPGNIPYTIRQNSGDDNSLGKIKFTFKNPFDVYLHDTPLKSKFKLNNRAVSHGCVRVQSPIDLAGFVLQGNTRVTYDDVLIKMGLPPTDTARAREWSEDTTSYKLVVKGTYPIKLENRMTVFFDYRTIVFDEFDRPRLIFDVYDKNRQIVEAMDKD